MLRKNSKTKTKEYKPTTKADYEELGKMLQSIYESGYADRKSFYKMTFIKGILTGLGGVIGATVVVGLLLWVLSVVDNVPFVENISEKLQDSVQTTP